MDASLFILLLAVAGIGLGLQALGKSQRFKDAVNRWMRRKIDDPYSHFNPNYYTSFFIQRAFTIKGLLGFKIRYELDLICHRRDDVEFKNSRMLEESAQQGHAEEYNEAVFLQHFRERKYLFTFDWQRPWPDSYAEIVRTPVVEILEKDGEILFREVLQTSLNVQLHPIMFAKNGCETQLGYFRNHVFPDELVEENYAMLTDEDKKAVEADDSYGPLVEMIAVAALKRRLEFSGRASKQEHKNEDLRVETEKAGRGLRIRWEFKNQGSFGYELLGYRKTGGFHSDPWDEDKNGTLVIHADGSGEVVEFLDQGQANFYTLVMQEPPRQDNSKVKRSALRFQVTIAPEKEMEAIEAALQRAEQRTRAVKPVDPDKEHIARAIKELGLFVELDAALEAKRRTWEKEIEDNEDYSAQEKAEKIERLRDTMATLRSKYEP